MTYSNRILFHLDTPVPVVIGDMILMAIPATTITMGTVIAVIMITIMTNMVTIPAMICINQAVTQIVLITVHWYDYLLFCSTTVIIFIAY